MKKLLILIPAIFLLSACGGQNKQACIDNCISALSAVCETDQTETCTNICGQDEGVRNCVMAAKSCDELDEKATLCFSKPESDEEATNYDKVGKEPSCESVCKKYSDCAGFGEDVTEQDKQDAYDSCMIECQSWSDEGLSCMDSKEIKNPADCMALSLCGAAEYQDRF